MNSCADSNDFIRVNGLVWRFAQDALYEFLYSRNASGATYENDFINVRLAELGIFQRRFYRDATTLDEVGAEFLEFSSCECSFEVLRTVLSCRDKGRLTSAWLTLESSIFAFSAASVSL